jgi:hypothetical protein
MFKWLNLALEESNDAAAAGLDAGEVAEEEEGEVEWVDEGEGWEEGEEGEEEVGLQLDLAGPKWVKNEHGEDEEEEGEEEVVEEAQAHKAAKASHEIIKAKGWSRAAAGLSSEVGEAAVASPAAATGEAGGAAVSEQQEQQQQEGAISAGGWLIYTAEG